MALICSVCNAENRDGANFCMRCGERLTPESAPPVPPAPVPNPSTRFEREWVATAPAQLRAATIPGELRDEGPARPQGDGERTVLVGAGRPTRSPPAAPSPATAAAPPTGGMRNPAAAAPPAARQRGMWIWVVLLLLGIAMLVGGWYGFGNRKGAAPATVPAASPAPATPSVAPLPATAVDPAPSPAETPPAAPAEARSAEPAPAAPAAADPPAAPSPAPAARPAAPTKSARKPPGTAAAPAAAETPAPAPAATPAPPPPVAAPADPQSQCAGRNFVARAQCMATQCARPEFRAHAQCEAVRRQQQLDEEKRNPTLIN